MQKIEESVNFIWHGAKLRGFAQRFSGYLSVLLLGPVLAFSAIGISSTLMAAAPLQPLFAVDAIASVVRVLGRVVSFGFVIGVFAFAYYFGPNAKVKLRAALTGGIAAGLLWEGAGWAFAEFARISTQYSAVYSSFALFLLFLIWLYLNWLILLLGASIAFYIQHPEYLVPQPGEPELSNRMRERIALMLMYLVAGTYQHGGPACTRSRLAERLGVPGHAVQAVLDALERDGLLARTGAEPPAYLPSRDIGSIALADLLRTVRAAGEEDYLGPDAVPVPAEVESILARADAAVEGEVSRLTLKDLLAPAPPSR
jgi:membrane protein